MNRRDGVMGFAAIAIVVAVLSQFGSAQTQTGPFAVWGTDSLAPPSGDFLAIASGGATQTLAIRDDGTLDLSGIGPLSQTEVPGGAGFTAVGLGRTHALAIRTDGSIVTWGTDVGSAPAGCFKAVAGGAFHSVALDCGGHVVVWGSASLLGGDYTAVVGVGAPQGLTFKAIAARGRYTLALTTDGQIYGWGVGSDIFDSSNYGWTADDVRHFFKAPTQALNPYISLAAGMGGTSNMPFNLMAAVRQDGSVVVWDPSHLLPSTPASTAFTQIAAGLGYVAGIDRAGRLHAWGDATHTAFATVPPGIYSAVSAATTHATAIAVPPERLSSIGPANPWVGLKNSDDVGTKFDLLAEVLHNGIAVTSGELDSVVGGGSGFNNAILSTIAIALTSPIAYGPGEVLSVRVSARVSARVAVNVAGHRSGTARLWYGDASANSRIEAVVNGVSRTYYLAPGFSLSVTPPSGPRSTADVFVDRAVGGNPFKPFGTWNVTPQP